VFKFSIRSARSGGETEVFSLVPFGSVKVALGGNAPKANCVRNDGGYVYVGRRKRSQMRCGRQRV